MAKLATRQLYPVKRLTCKKLKESFNNRQISKLISFFI